MPQTREHVAILQLFGVTRGAVALTKVDRVDEPGWTPSKRRSTRFSAPRVSRRADLSVSMRPPQSMMPGRRARLKRQHVRTEGIAAAMPGGGAAARLAPPTTQPTRGCFGWPSIACLRCPGMERRGWHGVLRFRHVGDTVVVFPVEHTRSACAASIPRTGPLTWAPGRTCALNLAGIEKSALKRGDWLADARVLSATTRIDVRWSCWRTPTLLKAWRPSIFTMAPPTLRPTWFRSMGRDHAGDHRYAQIVFETPICAVPGDRFIIRDAAPLIHWEAVRSRPVRTVPQAALTRTMRYLHALEANDRRRRTGAASRGGSLRRQTIRSGPPHRTFARMISLPMQSQSTAHATRYVMLWSAWQTLRQRATMGSASFTSHHPKSPARILVACADLVPQVPDDLWRSLIAELARDRAISAATLATSARPLGNVVCDEEALAAKLQPLIAAGRFNPPWVRDLAARSMRLRTMSVRYCGSKSPRGRVSGGAGPLLRPQLCSELAT